MTVAHTRTSIPARDGLIDAHLFTPEGEGAWPGVIFYSDVAGVRQVLFDMAERLASDNYAVLLPNIFYRHGPAAPIDMADRQRMAMLVQAVTPEAIVSDTKALIGFLDTQPCVAGLRIGVVGYCMGGGLALTAAAAFPERVAAAASFHGARLATDAADSPHRGASAMKGEIYVGVAETDPYLAPGETDELQAALEAAGRRYTVEVYPGVAHGFAVAGTPVYDQAAAEHHWRRLDELLQRTLRAIA